MLEMTVRLCAPVTDDGMIDERWCKAQRIAVADVHHGEIIGWQEFDVAWDRLHDEGPHEEHHQRMSGFLRDRTVNIVVVDHMGKCLSSSLTRMDIAVQQGASGEVRKAMLSALQEQLTR